MATEKEVAKIVSVAFYMLEYVPNSANRNIGQYKNFLIETT